MHSPSLSLSSQHKKAKRKPARPLRKKREDPQGTTREKQLQSRSNPHANVCLSGKKKRQLLKEAKRLMAEQLVMEGEDNSYSDGVSGLCMIYIYFSSDSIGTGAET